jgi:hypothetical protein
MEDGEFLSEGVIAYSMPLSVGDFNAFLPSQIAAIDNFWRCYKSSILQGPK